MGSKTVPTKIQQPFDTAVNWSTSNRILLQGEKVYAQVSAGAVRSKTGVGTKKFSELPYDDESLYESLAGKATSDLGNVSNDAFISKATGAGFGLEVAGVQEHLGDGVKHVTAGERATWNNKETPIGAQDKANTAEQNAKNASRPVAWTPTAAEVGAVKNTSVADIQIVASFPVSQTTGVMYILLEA